MAALGSKAAAGEATLAAIWIESQSPRKGCLLTPGADVQDAEISLERTAANGQKRPVDGYASAKGPAQSRLA